MVFDGKHLPGAEKPCRSCTDFREWLKYGPTKEARKEPPTGEARGSEGGSAGSGAAHQDTPPVQSPPVPAGPEQERVDQAVLDQKAGVCPPDRTGLGSATWTFLHSVAAYFPAKPRNGVDHSMT
jgi:FAD-linked sulfhydryl oxidase